MRIDKDYTLERFDHYAAEARQAVANGKSVVLAVHQPTEDDDTFRIEIRER